DNTAESSELWVGSEAIGTSETDVLTHYGAIISNPNSKGDSDKVTIAVPDEQVKVFAYVGPSGTVTATTSDVSYTYTGLTSEVAVLDSEATTTVPMIVVGGPYANSLARTLVGSDDAAIETFFGYDADAGTGKGIVKLYDSSETTWGVDAMLVAGWNSDDTRAAAYILGKYLSGSKSLSALSGKTKIAVTATDATTVTDETVE
ncbi:MAG: S-layer protein, partial [Candidatus Altiarchaeota archaeon]|nr:S-layer protein [Candidatus Altiarchaeota archaeon]